MEMIEHTLEVAIEAPVPRVWKALTGQATSWWHPGFFSRPNTQAFILEPRIGGRAYEDCGDGEGLIWYTVTGLAKHELLQLMGDLDATYGGPARLHTTFRLRADGDRTVVRMEECAFGRVDEKTRANLASGWKILLEGCLKVFAETGAPPAEWPKM